MAGYLEISLGDEVEMNFTLKYKKADVAKRPDAAAFRFVTLTVFQNEKKKVFTGGRHLAPEQIEVTKDDQPVTFRVMFLNGPEDPNFFVPGETWGVVAQYQGEDGTKPNYSTPLGSVKILGG